MSKILLLCSQKHAKMVVQSIEHVRLTKRIALQVHEEYKKQPNQPKTELCHVRMGGIKQDACKANEHDNTTSVRSK